MIKRYINALINDDELTGGQFIATVVIIFLASGLIMGGLNWLLS